MRNKVKRNNLRRLTAVILMLLMIMGSFSVASFAQEIPEQKTAETTETAPAETAVPSATQPAATEAAQPSAPAAAQPAAAEQPAAESSQTENISAPKADTSQADNGDLQKETQPAAEETQSKAEETQPASDADQFVEEASQPDVAVDASDKEVKSMAPAQSEAASSESKNEAASTGSGDAGTHKLTIDSREMPRSISLSFYIKSGNTITEYVYDGTTITDMTNDKDVTDVGLIVAAGSALTVQRVIGLEREEDFQQGDSPGGKCTKQLKLILKDSSGKEIQRLSLNNSSNMNSISLSLDGAITAVIGIANRVKVTSSSDMYHKGSCIVMNTTDSGPKASEFSDFYAMPGDKISIDYGNSYERVDANITDAAGKRVAFNNGTFTMPSSMTTAILTYYYEARTVNVVNNAPERGTISIKKDKYHPGDKVVVNIKANSGYKFDTKTLAYLYKKDGKWAVQKITKDKDGKYSFIMPFLDIDIRGVFVSNETAAGSSNPTSFIDYSAYADDEEEEAAVEEEASIPAEEENLQEMLDVTPLVSRIVAETVLTATVSVAAMTH